MRKMRNSAKWMMLVLTLAFVAWLVLEGIQTSSGQGAQQNPVVGVVNGEEIRYVEWRRQREAQLDQARQQVEGSLSDQQRHRVEEQAWDQLVSETLVEQELRRLGYGASEDEIRRAFRTSPPPSLRDHPAFQTDGRFDMQKYRDFFSRPSVDEQLLLQIESYYRRQIPRNKLFRAVAEEVALSDEDLWRHYRDRNGTARVEFVSLSADRAVPDSAVRVTPEEIRSHYEEHRDDFSRPPVAVVDLVSLEAEPSAADSARARARLDSLRTILAETDTTFRELVARISETSPPGLQAAELGTIGRDEMVGPLRDVAFSLAPGEVSEPVTSPSGYHLVEVSSRQGDRVTLSHILAPVQLSMDAEDDLFDRMDRLEGIALRSDLETAADSLGMRIRDDLRLEKGSEFVPGAGNLGVAVAWAFESGTPVGALSQFFENASGHHLLELEDRLSSGVRPLDEVRQQVRDRILQKKKEEALRRSLEAAVEEIRSGDATLEEVADRNGWDVRTSGTFTRVGSVPGLGQNTPAVGAAFGLEPGEVAGPFGAGGDRYAVIRLVDRSPASREAFRQQKEQMRGRLQQQLQQQRLNRWMQALREEAEIRDLRDQLDGGRGGGVGSSPVS